MFFFPRPEFVSGFSKLSDQWQRAARGVQQRKCDISRLVTQWRFFTTSVEDLLRFLTDTGHLLSAVKEQECYSLCQTRRLIHELKSKEIHVQRWRTTYELALEAGEKLRDTSNPETREFIDRQTSRLQDTWRDTELSLGEMISRLQSTAEVHGRHCQILHVALGCGTGGVVFFFKSFILNFSNES